LNKYVAELNKVGQSLWYDNVSKDALAGELRGLIADGISGLTSNPSIFKKAIAESSAYDADIKSLAKKGLDVEGVCEELMIADVAAAADLLRPVYDKTKGVDGYASIEVSPFLASDTKSTVECAKRLWSKLKRPNIMIKVPATKEGIPAIEALIKDNINVNVTLIFSVEAYTSVAKAYINALNARHKAGQNVDGVASVASFFVSRVDSAIEKHLAGKPQLNEYLGKLGIANSKLAYSKFDELFNDPDFKALKAAGAKVQRPLWASTGVKNPAFSPVLYVEELAGADTVNTAPPDTIKAFLKGAKVEGRIGTNMQAAKDLVSKLPSVGVDLSKMLNELLAQGVTLFESAYRDLLTSVENKMK
jgi:transaldolase